MFFVRGISNYKNNPKNVILLGKERIVVEWMQYVGEREYVRHRFNVETARKYGFKRECDAKRSSAYRMYKGYGMDTEIVEVDC